MASFDALDAAESVGNVLREHADFGEQAGCLAPASVEALRRSGMLSLWRPQSLDGHECDPVSYARAAEKIATADTAAAWLMHGVSAAWFDLRRGTPEFVDEIIGSAPVPVLAETFNKPMRAIAHGDGYTVTGSTPFASGCRVAEWIGHTAIADDRLLLMYHPADTLEIADDWNSLGMRGTASNTIVARETFVPRYRTIDLSVPLSRTPRFDGPLYRMPEAVIPVAVAAVSLGALRSALDATTAIAADKIPFAAPSTLKHRPLAQLQFGRALATYRAARAYFHECIERAFGQAGRGEAFALREKADLFLAFAHTLQTCADGVRLLAKAVGTSAIYKGNAIERALRDTEVISHHAFGAEGRFATVAQAYWDLDVDFPLLAMD